MNRIITAIDLGTSNIRAASAMLDKTGKIELLGLEHIPSSGVDYGNIVDFESACADIEEILYRLSRKTKKSIMNVSVSVSGPEIKAIEATGMVALSKKPRQISYKDIEKCIGIASMVNVPTDRQIIQKITHGFYINEGQFVINPAELYATKLGVKLYMIIADSSKIKNIAKCVEHTGYILDNVVYSASAIAEAVLNEEESSSVILDIGNKTTNIALFSEKNIQYIDVFPQGGKDMETQDAVNNFLAAVKGRLEGKQFKRIAMTGGGALTDNLLETAQNVFGVDCYLGRVKLSWCSLDAQDMLMHVTTIGLIAYEAKKLAALKKIRNPITHISRFVTSLMDNYF